MVTLVIAAVLVTIGIPSLQSVIQNSRLTTQANNILADLAVARSEAIKRGVSVTICRSQNPTASPPSCNSTSANWASGWVIFIDANNDGSIQSTETLLRVHEPLEGNNTLNTVQIVPPSTTSSIHSWVFTANGQTKLTATSRVEMRLCDSRGTTRGKVITVNFIGRAGSSSPPSSCGTT